MVRTSALLVGLIALLGLGATAAQAGTHTAHCKGDGEVVPVETHGQCQALFRSAGDALEYKLVVANLREIFASHIHCGPEGQNGPVGVTLFSGGPVTVSGILAQGPILAPDAGNACGWIDVADVLDAIDAGNAYVNVHTLAHPSGEVRGQIR